MSDPQFATALELATYFNGTTELADLEPEFIAQADLLLQMIAVDIEAAAGTTFEVGARTASLPGTWSRDLVLPVGPVSGITAVSLNGQAVSTGDYVFNERGLLRRGVGGTWEEDTDDAYYEDWSALGTQGASWRAGAHWGGPFSTINVAWTAGGFTEVPSVLKSLSLRIAARTFGNVGQVTQESLAIYSVSYGASSNNNDGSHVTTAERLRLRSMFNRTGGTIQTGGR